MNRYLLFQGQDYYPSGGMEDFEKSSNDLEELKASAFNEWAHIYDCFEEKIILEGRKVSDFENGYKYKFEWTPIKN